jgi:hypoxanthine phosphoribosyltransferase
VINTKLKDNAPISEEGSPKEYCTWMEIETLVEKLVYVLLASNKKYDIILAITTGGIVPARLIARELEINYIQLIPIRNKKLHIEEMPSLYIGKKYLIVDDIYDTGHTFAKVFKVVKNFDNDFAFLMTRYKDSNAALVAKVLDHEKWIVFPWEKKYF